jgi:hypothetical protein
MAGAARKLKIAVPTELQCTAELAPFRPSGNLKFLDFSKLRSRRRRLEVGEYDGGCCATKLYAVVERGMVVRLELEKRARSKPPPPFLKAILVKAVESLSARASSDPLPLPMPIADFVLAMESRTGPSGPMRTTYCISLTVKLPWVGEVSILCCVTWHRDANGKVVIDEIGCGDVSSFRF